MNKPEGVGIRGAGSAQPEPTDETLLAMENSWFVTGSATLYRVRCKRLYEIAVRAALAAITPTDPALHSVHQTERSVESPEAAGLTPASFDTKALETAREIALMWGQDRSHFVSKIQVAVLDAMRWAAPGRF